MTALRSALHCAVASAALLALGALPAAAGAAPKAKSSAKAHKPAPKAEAAPADATPEQIAAAERVYYGNYECEFKQTVEIEKNAKYPAYVNVKNGKAHWLMKPVVSSTGAVRLEDLKGETLMVQIASKSMLLNVKTAHRIVDDCISPTQRELIEAARVAKEAQLAAASAGGSSAATPPPLLLETPPSAAAQPVATAASQAR